MTCSVFIPCCTREEEKFPGLFYLSGLTCTDLNVCEKSGAFRYLAQHRIAMVCPDTSPRGAGVDGESTSGWDFGVGAGFYLDALVAPFSENYRMYSYTTKELPQVIGEHFPSIDLSRLGIFGHSMGGHGALSIALKNPTLFRSVSAFAPICEPCECAWGVKAFSGYLGADDRTATGAGTWAQYDSVQLMKAMAAASPEGEGGQEQPFPFDDILIDVGTSDSFYIAGQ